MVSWPSSGGAAARTLTQRPVPRQRKRPRRPPCEQDPARRLRLRSALPGASRPAWEQVTGVRYRLEVRLTPADVGQRVVIRWRRPSPGDGEQIADVLGILEENDSTSFAVRTSDGALVVIPAARAITRPDSDLHDQVAGGAGSSSKVLATRSTVTRPSSGSVRATRRVMPWEACSGSAVPPSAASQALKSSRRCDRSGAEHSPVRAAPALWTVQRIGGRSSVAARSRSWPSTWCAPRCQAACSARVTGLTDPSLPMVARVTLELGNPAVPESCRRLDLSVPPT